MAVVSQITCAGCGFVSHVSHSPSDAPPKVCHQCARKSAEQVRAEKLKALGELPIEERLARIEAWIYDYRPPRSINDMVF